MKIHEQIKEFNEFFKNNSMIIIISLFFSIIPLIKMPEKNNILNLLSLGASILLIIFLLSILLYQSGKTVWNAKLKDANWIMIIFFTLYSVFVSNFALKLIKDNSTAVAFTSGWTTGVIVASIIMAICVIVPVIFSKFMLKISFEQNNKKAKWTIILMTFLLLSIVTPLITYFARNDINIEIFLIPVTFCTLSGISMLIIALTTKN